MKIIKSSDRDFNTVVSALVNRLDVDLTSQDETVRQIIRDVKRDGDEALLEYTNRFDRTHYGSQDLKASPEEIPAPQPTLN